MVEAKHIYFSYSISYWFFKIVFSYVSTVITIRLFKTLLYKSSEAIYPAKSSYNLLNNLNASKKSINFCIKFLVLWRNHCVYSVFAFNSLKFVKRIFWKIIQINFFSQIFWANFLVFQAFLFTLEFFLSKRLPLYL